MTITWSVIETTDRTGSSGTTSTITGVPFGTSAVDRHVAVFLTTLNGSGAISAVTIAGQTTYVTGTGNSNITTIAVAKIPAGTSSGNVVATLTGTDQLYSFGVMAVFGAHTTSGLYDTAQQDGPTACLIDIPAGGVILGSALAWQSGAGTWSNITETIAWDSASACAAAAYTGSAQTNRSVGYSTANGTSFLSMSAAAGSSINASASQTIGVGQSSTGTVIAKAQAAQTVGVSQSAAATVAVKASASQSIAIGQSALAGVTVKASASQAIAIGQTASAAVIVKAIAESTIAVGQVATAQQTIIPTPAGRTLRVAPESRLFIVPAETRVVRVAPESRIIAA